MEVKIGRAGVEVVKGDITDLEVDAIVNAANDHLWMGSGVAGAIKKKGGDEIEAEAMAKGPVPVGEVVVTGAGRLKAKYVFHAAVMGQNLKTDAEKIATATKRSLEKADELGIESIAFPAFGTGVGGFPVHESARNIIDTIIKYLLNSKTGLRKITLALFDENTYNIFRTVLEAYFRRQK